MDFVIGHPRSGTMYLSHLLNSGGREVSRHELLYALTFAVDSPAVSIPTLWYEKRVGRAAVSSLLDAYGSLSDSDPRIDCNHKLVWILPLLLERFPEARIVHLSRNARDNVRACYNLDYYGHQDSAVDEHARHWLKSMPRIARPDWEQLNQFEMNCAFWAETHDLALRHLEGHTRRLHLKLEELSTPRACSRIFEFFDLPSPPEETLAAAIGARINSKEEEKLAVAALRPLLPPHANWPEEHKRTLSTICGPTARKLGYDDP